MKLATIIYPGEMWGKRLAHLVTISAIGFTLFLGHVQSDLISRSDRLFQQGFQAGTETLNEINTGIEKGYITKKIIDLIFDTEKIKTSDDLQKTLTGTIQTLTEAREATGALHKTANIILFITGLLMIRIGYAIFWIFLDIKRGNAAAKMKKLVWIAMITNVVTLLACTIIYYFIMDQMQPFPKGDNLIDTKAPPAEIGR